MSDKPLGKIITFYSYKGGTGRSMALANVAWLLASQGHRVLAIDWDLEAPGLHRYFHPFFEDKELASTRGLIDFVIDFVEAAKTPSTKELGESWYEAYSDLSRYAFSLDWEFPGEGTLDFVPAGRQGPAYSIRVTAMDWRELYEKMGGGLWLEAVKKQLREDYDYVLIDSRTGISDTAGICTIQMPDELVVCFTLNQQSIRGAAAVAESAWSQRIKPNGEPALKIWPVPMRVELGEKDRLARAREFARTMFEFYIGHLGGEREAYWEDTEVLYEPFYAYEEVLAPFAERHRTRATLLRSMEMLASRFGDSAIESQLIPDEDRNKVLALFTNLSETGSRRGTIFFSSRAVESELRKRVFGELDHRYPGMVAIADTSKLLLPGDDLRDVVAKSVDRASVGIILIGPYLRKSTDEMKWVQEEVRLLRKMNIPVIPVVDRDVSWPMPQLLDLEYVVPAYVSTQESLPESLFRAIDKALSDSRQSTVDLDPQKGRWGKESSHHQRRITATVTPVSKDWFDVRLTVEASNGKPLEGTVAFHLDPSKARPVDPVPVRDGRAVLRFGTWGAFTVGAVADNGLTTLELDLAELPDAPERFRKG